MRLQVPDGVAASQPVVNLAVHPAELGAALRRLRTAWGLTQGQLAALTCLAAPAVSRLEGGRIRSPEIGTVYRLTKGLAVADRLAFSRHRELDRDALALLLATYAGEKL
ncbi:helix-turn-helix domain-containing protein [Pseudonocardia sp. DLS-67]